MATQVSGLLGAANGGTGVDGSAAANGKLLIGNGAGYTLATLTPGANITITNGAGTITIASTDTGEANTASNIGTAGVGVYKQKTGVNLELKKINAGSNKVTITDDAVNDEVDIDLSLGNIGLASLGGTLNLATQVSGTLAAANGGTGVAAYTAGDLLYASGAAALAKLAVGANPNAPSSSSPAASGADMAPL